MIELVSFDGFALNTADYQSGLPYDGQPFARSVAPIVLPVVGGYPRTEGYDHLEADFQVEVLIQGDLVAGMAALLGVFRAGKTGELVATFDGVSRVRECIVESAFPMADNGSRFIVNLVAADPRWRGTTVLTESGSFTASGQSITVNNPGNAVEDRAIIRLTPTVNKAASASQRFRRYAIIANRAKRALLDHPIDITNGGIDHAALVTAGKSTASGQDIRVLLNGRAIPYWFGEHANTDANSATTKIWCNIQWSAMREAHLLANITGSVPANGGELQVAADEVVGWPRRGYILNDTTGEVIAYTGWVRRNASGNSAFTGIRRGVWGTTAASATAGDRLLRAQHKIEIVYGQTTGLAAPAARPDVKPLLDLASSTLTNVRHEWVNWWDDTYPDRTGAWSRRFEPRDAQAGFIFANRGSPAATADFVYNYFNPPVSRDNFNVLYREFPTGTSGASGQLAMTRVVDGTLMAEVRGVLDDGSEHLLASLKGPLTSATFTSAFTQKLYGVTLYTRSQVAQSPPEMEGSPLLDQMSSSAYYAQVNAVNTTGNIYGAFVNESGGLLAVAGIQAIVWQPGTPHTNIVVSVRADDGAGAPSINELAQGTITSGSVPTNPAWAAVAFSRPFPWAVGQKIHVNVQSGGASSSNTLWGHQPMEHAGAYPMRAVRFIGGAGEIADYARAEGGGGAVWAPAAGDNTTFDAGVALLDSAATPYFALTAEADCYWLNGTLVNETTLQQIAFDLYITTGNTITLDVGDRTMRNDGAPEDDLLRFITASDEEALISLVAGDSVLRWDEVGCTGMGLAVDYVARYE